MMEGVNVIVGGVNVVARVAWRVMHTESVDWVDRGWSQGL